MRLLTWAVLGVLSLGGLGCPKPKEPEVPAPQPPAMPEAKAPPAVPSEPEAVDSGSAAAAPTGAGEGSIEGTVVFQGQAPEMQQLKRGSDPVCGKVPMKDETVVVKDGKLHNVVVRISQNAPTGGKAPTEPIVVDQQDCMYRPRVQAAMKGQPMLIKNSDGTLHNIHSYVGTKTWFNQAQPGRGKPIDKTIEVGSEVVKLKCDVHPWMTGYIIVSEHPYFAAAPEGSFKLKDVPAGQYTLEAWHEKLGTKTAQVTVKAGETAQAQFTFAP